MSDMTGGIFELGGPLGERPERESEPSDHIAAQIREEQEDANATREAAIGRGAKGLGADDAYGGYRGMWRDAEDEVQTLRAEAAKAKAYRAALEELRKAGGALYPAASEVENAGNFDVAPLGCAIGWLKALDTYHAVLGEVSPSQQDRYRCVAEEDPDEPYGAGADPYGRPDPLTHPEYWTE